MQQEDVNHHKTPKKKSLLIAVSCFDSTFDVSFKNLNKTQGVFLGKKSFIKYNKGMKRIDGWRAWRGRGKTCDR